MQRRSPASKVAARRFLTFCREVVKWSNVGSWSEGAISVVDIRCRMCSYANKMVVWGRGGHSPLDLLASAHDRSLFSTCRAAAAPRQLPISSSLRPAERRERAALHPQMPDTPPRAGYSRGTGVETTGPCATRIPLAIAWRLEAEPQRFLLITALKRYEPNVKIYTL